MLIALVGVRASFEKNRSQKTAHTGNKREIEDQVARKQIPDMASRYWRGVSVMTFGGELRKCWGGNCIEKKRREIV